RSGGPQIVVSKELTFDKNSGDWTFGRFVFAAPAGSPELEYVAFAADGGVGGLYYPTFGPANASEITQYRAEVFQLFEIRPTGNAAEPYQFKDVIFREGPGIKLKVGMQDGQLAVTIVSPSSDDKKVACFGTTGASKRDEISQALNIKSGGKYKLTMRLRLDEIKNPCVYGGATFSIPGTENGKQALSGDAKIYGRKGEIVQVQLVFKVPDEIRPADKSIITNTTVRFGEGVYTIIGRPEWSPASDSDVTGYVPAQAQAAPVFTVKSDGKGGFLPVNFELDKRYLKGTSLELIPFARTEDKPNAQVTAPYFIRLISAADSGEGRALITTANYLSDIPVIPGQRYALKLWFKRVTGPATGTVSVLTRYRNSQGKLLSDEEIIRLGARINMRGIPSGRWVQLQFVTTAPPGCKSIGQFMISSGTGEWHACEPVFVSPVKASDETGQDGLKYPLAPEQETRFGDQPIFLFGTGLRLSGDGTYKEPYLPEIRGIIRALAAEPGTPDGQPYYFLMVPEKGGKDSYVAGYANQGSRESIVFTVQELKAHPAGVIVTYYARLAPGSKKASTGFYSYIGAMSLESGGVPKGLSVKLTTDEHGNRWHRIDLVLKPSDLPPPDPSGKYSFYGFAINGFDDATHITRPVLRWARRDEATGAYPISQQAQPAQITPAPNLSQPALTSI
ncbi:MAG: hypothetical protein NTV07_00835, partial [Candidatus Omnitrophica bacterium]|nr:hypothetical protein [Candidatus Omnitrophota bacterium]